MKKLIYAAILVLVMLGFGFAMYELGNSTGYHMGAYDTWNEAYRQGASDGLMSCTELERRSGIERL